MTLAAISIIILSIFISHRHCGHVTANNMEDFLQNPQWVLVEDSTKNDVGANSKPKPSSKSAPKVAPAGKLKPERVPPQSKQKEYPEQHEVVTQQQALVQYLSSRDRCKWQDLGFRQNCGMKVQTCLINATVEEGDGYYSITRFGPFTTTGGIQNVLCKQQVHSPPAGAFFTRSFSAPLDPYTGEMIGYPPLHIHHSVFENSDQPPIPKQLYSHMPWLSLAEYITAPLTIGAVAADTECRVEHGGTNCFFKLWPTGTGRKAYGTPGKNFFTFHVQDVRLDQSPPISAYFESAQFYVTKMNKRKPPLLPSLDLSLSVGGTERQPFTYKLAYNTSMYQFFTYYFSMTVQIDGSYFHTHSVNGDEAWVVRGTQADLGIPHALRRVVDATDGGNKVGGVFKPLPLPVGDSLAALKLRMEQSLDTAAKVYDEKQNRVAKEPYHYDHEGKVRERKAIAKFIGKTAPGFDFKPYNASSQESRSRPEILCKWKAANAQLTLQDISAQRKSWQTSYEKVFTNQQHSADSPDAALHPILPVTTSTQPIIEDEQSDDFIDPRLKKNGIRDNSVYKPRPSVKTPVVPTIISPVDQKRNMMRGTYPGQYYRQFLNNEQTDPANNAYNNQCQKFTVHAGDYLTIVHFNEPRIAPKDATIYDNTEVSVIQHTYFNAQGHVVGLPFY